mgnify:CR=1 FL=1
MAELKVVDPKATKAKRGPGGKSDIQYPYFDLNDSILVARAVHERGGGTCSRAQLAAFLEYKTTKSGTFISRIYAAKQFGLVEFDGNTVSCVDRATRILHPVFEQDEAIARVEAFLSVPLFSTVFEAFDGKQLPADVGLQNMLENRLGIVPDRVKPALRVLMNSAEQAGFFATTGNKSRMIKPVLTGTPPSPSDPAPPPIKAEVTELPKPISGQWGTGGGDGPPPGVHPALVAMLRELPRAGADWPQVKKDRFLTAFRSILDVVYPEPEEVP